MRGGTTWIHAGMAGVTMCALGCAQSPKPSAIAVTAQVGPAVESVCAPPGEDAEPLLARADGGAIHALLASMKSGVVVAEYTCGNLVLLPGCEIDGEYRSLARGMTTSRAIHLRDSEELDVNAPRISVGSLDEGGGGQAAKESGFNLVVTEERTTLRAVAKPELLKPTCRNATHFIKAVSFGGLGPSVTAQNCAGSTCEQPVRLRLRAIGTLPTISYPEGLVSSPCPEGWAVAEGRCIRSSSDAPHQCRATEPSECDRQCKRGSIESCLISALLNLTDHEPETEDESRGRAKALLRRACRADDARACHMLGALLQSLGESRRSREFAARGCALGHGGCCLQLAYLPAKADEPDMDEVKALEDKACAGGEPLACLIVPDRNASPDDPEAVRKVKERLVALCELGHGGPCFALTDLAGSEEVRAYAEKGCWYGQASACSPAGYAYYQEGNYAAAIPLFTRGCEGSESPSCRLLADYARQGHGVARNPAEALRLYEKACRIPCRESSNYIACTAAGLMLLDGKDVPKDEEKAIRLLRKACKYGGPNSSEGCSALSKLGITP